MTRVRRGLFLCLVLALPVLALGQGAARLHVSLPPVLASLPIAFAEEWGLFDAHGVDVEIIGMTDSGVRSMALASGDLDLVLEDVTQFLVDLAEKDLVATSAAFVRLQSASMEVALVSPSSFGLQTVDDLVASGYSVGTVWPSDQEYLLDRLFDGILDDGVRHPRYSYDAAGVLDLAIWFGAGMMPAAALPEPYISYIGAYIPEGGTRPLVQVVTLDDFSEFDPLPQLVVFRAEYVAAHPESVEAFYAGYVEAIERLNGMTRDEIVDTGLGVVLPLFFQGANPDLIGQDVLDALAIPSFELPTCLDEAQFDSVLTWALGKGYVHVRPTYAAAVDSSFIP
jgi:ABC-type nitrate/sulfonate/bicarbonate transport system substrate-binding protein